jgi:hypothetical protein
LCHYPEETKKAKKGKKGNFFLSGSTTVNRSLQYLTT